MATAPEAVAARTGKGHQDRLDPVAQRQVLMPGNAGADSHLSPCAKFRSHFLPADRPMITCIPTFSHTCKTPGDASRKPSKGAKNPWEICGLRRRLDLNKD